MSHPSTTVSIATSVILFFIALVLEQIYDVIILNAVIPAWSYMALHLSIPCIGLVVFGIFVKLTKSSFKNQGYKKPAGVSTPKCVLLSLFF